MATKKISGSKISGEIQAPASKSFAQRAMAASLLARGTSIVRNPGRSDDAMAALRVIQSLGAEVEDFGDRYIIHGGLSQVRSSLDFGEAGLGIRLFASIAALLPYPVYLTGSGSLSSRPMQIIEEALSALGVSCKTEDGYLPIRVQGPVKGGEIHIDGSISSQVLTGLLMALPMAEGDSIITVDNLRSTPYVDMTLEILEDFGIKVSHDNYEKFFIPGMQSYDPIEYNIEGDWSGAAFLLVAGVIAGNLKISGLNTDSLQADRKIMEALQKAGAELTIEQNVISCKGGKLKAFEFDATHCPDLFPPLIALAAHCNGTTRILGADRLVHKESNRAAALESEMTKLGLDIRIADNVMVVEGPAKITGGKVDSHNDHRIAMAAATIILPADGQEVEISGSECIAKSYPAFYDDLKLIGGQVNE